MQRQALFGDFNAAALWAGLSAYVWYAFGTVPLQVAVSAQLALDAPQSSSWIFIVWFTGAVSTVALSLYYRQPIPITWTIPGLVYLGTLAGQFTFSEIVGANLLAGFLIVALGLMGMGERVMAWLPLPIVMGMFAGSILTYVTGMVTATVEDALIAGPTVIGYLLGRAIGNRNVPPVGLAVICGGLASIFGHHATLNSLSWTLPTVIVPDISFSPSAFVTITLPMLVLSMGLGNVQGLGFLKAQGYRVPVNTATVVVGINSIVNAFFGGHPGIVARTGVAIVAGPDAGPLCYRYWASLVAAFLTLTIALAASPVTSLIAILPRAYVLALAGLAILSSFQDSFEKAFSERFKFGAIVAFAVAATPFAIAGITSACWAIVAGLVASWLAERDDLKAHWQEKG